jgi:hypothetical protein
MARGIPAVGLLVQVDAGVVERDAPNPLAVEALAAASPRGAPVSPLHEPHTP